MEKYAVIKNEQVIGEFSTLSSRQDQGFPEEFYSLLMPYVNEAENENLENKFWSNSDRDFNFKAKNNDYIVKNLKTLKD